jgi:hypothetical protein
LSKTSMSICHSRRLSAETRDMPGGRTPWICQACQRAPSRITVYCSTRWQSILSTTMSYLSQLLLQPLAAHARHRGVRLRSRRSVRLCRAPAAPVYPLLQFASPGNDTSRLRPFSSNEYNAVTVWSVRLLMPTAVSADGTPRFKACALA